MATVTLASEADVTVRRDTAIAAGLGNHLPVGYWSGAIYRSVIRFPIPAGWTGWTSITSATLNIYVTDHAHVGVRNSQFYVRRGSWSKAAGTQDCESGYSGSNTTQDSDITVTSTDQVSTNSGSTVNLKRAVGVTNLVGWYRDNAASKIVLILDPVSSADYMEFWSREHTGSYDPTLDIVYTVQTNPNPPTLVAPAAGATVDSLTPTFSWTPDLSQGPQTDAAVILYDAAQNWLDEKHVVVGSDTSLVWPYALVRGTTYKWTAWTTSNGLDSPNPVPQSFTVRALPVVTISPTRQMVFANGAPRLQVNWSVNQPQNTYRVQTASGYDSGVLTSSASSHVLSTRTLVDNVAESVTVTITSPASPADLTGAATQSFTPRYGLTTHRRDLGSVPIAWVGVSINSTVPAGATLQLEYGSAATALAAPTGGWFSSLSAVPKLQFLYWRAWFIPSATAGPTLDTITFTTNNTAALVDKWGTTRDTTGLVAPWSIDAGESVYGSRSMRADGAGAASTAYSFKLHLRAGRNYTLSGMMKSTGNSGATFQLADPAGTVLASSPVLAATTDWFDPVKRAPNRYQTPVFAAPTDMDVYVQLRIAGTASTSAWFDAIKLEESTVATPWSPGLLGAAVEDAAGVQVDGSRGGILRYKGTDGAARSVVGGGVSGLLFAGDTELASPSTGVLAIAGVPILLANSGTAFPVAPTTGQRYFRTDLGMEFYWDGTRWLSSVLYSAVPHSTSPNITTSTEVSRWGILPPVGTDILIVSFSPSYLVTTGTALSASHKWVVTFTKFNSAGSAAVTGVHNMASGASGASAWRSDPPIASGDLLGAYALVTANGAKTGTPGPLWWYGLLNYRIVAT